MKNKTYLILSIISFVLGGLSCGIVLLSLLLGSFFCGKPFHIIYGSSGPIPTCDSILKTDFVWFLIIGIFLLAIGGIFLIINRKKVKK